MNASSDTTMAAAQLIFVAALLGWWIYIGGVVLGGVVLGRRIDRLRRAAITTILLQFAPVIALVVLFAVAAVELALDRALPSVLTQGLASVALLAGPAASLWLIITMTSGRRAAPR